LKHRVPIFLVILALSCCCLRAQQGPTEQDEFQAVEKAGSGLWQAKKYKQAVNVLLSIYNDGYFLDLPSDKRISIFYNLACGMFFAWREGQDRFLFGTGFGRRVRRLL